MVHRIQNRNPGYSYFSNLGPTPSFNFSTNSSNPVSHGANALKQLTQHFMASKGDDKAMAMVAYPIVQTLSDQGGVNRGVC